MLKYNHDVVGEYSQRIIINNDFSKPDLFNKELLQGLEAQMYAFYPIKNVLQFKRQIEGQYPFSLFRERAYKFYKRNRILQTRLKYAKILQTIYWKRKCRAAEREFLTPYKCQFSESQAKLF